MNQRNSFGAEATLAVGGEEFTIYRLDALEGLRAQITRLPYAMKILLENLLRHEDGVSVTAADVQAVACWDAASTANGEIAFTPGRVIHQDFTGVPSVVDLAAMRDAMKRLGGDPRRIDPLQPVELVIDHSIQVDAHGTSEAFGRNGEIEFERNRERYRFLRWGQGAFGNFEVVPPQTGIVHQVNLEHLARVVLTDERGGRRRAYPDTLVGTDSHTTMVNGLGVLGWGCGGIEAEAVMLGQPVSMLVPQVVGFELKGSLPEGATATDLVLTVTQALRERGVVGKFVEFFGDGLCSLSLADRATIANMAPEYGATCGIFPIDDETIRYLRLSSRSPQRVALVEAYAKEQGLFHTSTSPVAHYSEAVTLELGTVEASVAGPRRPQDRISLAGVSRSFRQTLAELRLGAETPVKPRATTVTLGEQSHEIGDGSVVIAAITSCTNTSNPALLFAAGLLARKAVERGLKTKPWVKTSFAPGSRVATQYLAKAGLMPALEALRFHLVGYGCTTCVGNSGPLPRPVSEAVDEAELVVAAVLSGNRNFEGRVHPRVRANYLASPPLVVAYALAGRVDLDLRRAPLGHDADGEPVFLRDIWPSREEIAHAIDGTLDSAMFDMVYRDVFEGDDRWRALDVSDDDLYRWREDSTYVKNPPYFDDMTRELPELVPIRGARVLAWLGDSITTDHISPAGNIPADSPAGRYLVAQGIAPESFNAYGARRGNHEVMMRGTFANVRLRNRMAPGTEGGLTRHLPSGKVMSIFDASVLYRAEEVPLLVLAGKEYGTGSSRDWAAKGPSLIGVRAVLAESFERIHRSNLIGMGIVPLEFMAGDGAGSLGLTGEEVYEIVGLERLLEEGLDGNRWVTVRATDAAGRVLEFRATVRIDTPRELLYYRHGGILQYVLRVLLEEGESR